MRPHQILPSTTSHKHEPLVPTLEIFSRLGLFEIDLNLNHLIERDTPLDQVRAALAANRQHVRMVSGGWCDFFDPDPQIDGTFASVARQVAMARAFGVDRLRLFFGRLPVERYGPAARATVCRNLQRLADQHPDMLFVFENHDGASSRPAICRQILEDVDRPSVRLNFDPINFEHAGADSRHAVGELLPLVAHVHLKGLDRGTFCGFGEGDVDLIPVLESLIAGGYTGAFTVEYEGTFDRTLRLFQSVRRAESVVAGLLAQFR